MKYFTMSLKIFSDPDNVLQTPVQLPAKSLSFRDRDISALSQSEHATSQKNFHPGRHQMMTMRYDWADIGVNLVIVHDNFTGIVFLFSSVNKAEKAWATF